VQSVISTFFTLSRGFVVGCGDPPKDLHSKIHGITAVVALQFRGRVPTPIAQPRTRRCLNCSRKTCPFVALGASQVTALVPRSLLGIDQKLPSPIQRGKNGKTSPTKSGFR
jgi:hypothetical protein